MGGIHHVSIVVRDLEAAIASYAQLLPRCCIVRETLTERGVRTARISIGDSWIVLVEPVVRDGVVAERLARHGEGVFVVSLDASEAAVAIGIDDRSDTNAADSTPRPGLAHWWVRDVAKLHEGHLTLQICEDPES